MFGRFAIAALAATLFTTPAFAQGRGNQEAGGGAPPPIAERTKNLKKIDGFFPLYWDENAGKLFVEIPKLDTEVLYSTGMATGLGSNDIGIDRGQTTGSRIVKFEKAGPRILMVQPNYQFRALDAECGGSARPSATRSRARCSGASRSRPPATAATWSTTTISWSATRTRSPDA